VIQSAFKHITDNELLKKYQTDLNKEWLGILLQRYTLLLLGVCMKYLKNEEEAKDAVQQIFLKALNELEKYPVDYPKSWLYKIACNYCLMKLRDKKQFISIDNTPELIEIQDSGKESPIEREMSLGLLESSLEELNKEQKTCITLFYLQKKSYQQITSMTGYSLLQVKSNIQNGKRNLKILIEKKQSF
jgi:RNA polymerase sigma-70 factor (ECF subfamily)